DIHVRELFNPRHVLIRFTWANGDAIKNEFVLLAAKGSKNPSAMSNLDWPDRKSSVVDLSILPNESYDVEGSLTCLYADDHSQGPGAKLHTNSIHIEPGDGQSNLVLALREDGCPEVPGKRLTTKH